MLPFIAYPPGCGLFKQILTLLLAAAMCLPAPGLAGPAPAGGWAKSEREQYLDRTLDAIGALRQALDRTAFDTEALLESLDYDPDAIIAFVRKNIRFEPYEGLLRGVEGTLMGRAGNALDQSVLLAFLLRGAGVDVRLASGTLSDAQALELVRSLQGQKIPHWPTLEAQPGLRAAIEDIAGMTGDEAMANAILALVDEVHQPQEMPLWAVAQEGTDYLHQHLRQAGIALAPTDAEASLAALSRAYFWVEYRDGAAAAAWARVHALPTGDAFDVQSLPAQEYFADEVPTRLQHRLRLTAKLERQVGDTSEVVSLMAPWERPVANLIGKRLTFANQPNGLRSYQDLSALDAVEAGTTFLIPSLNDAAAPGAMAFDTRGRTVALDALGMDSFGASALFQTLGNQGQAASAALSGLAFGASGDTPKAGGQHLRRVWLEYTSLHPDGTERVDERTIWQAEPMSQEASALLWSLTVPHGIGVAVSAYPQSYLLDLELSRLQSMEPLLRWALAVLQAPADATAPRMPGLDARWSGTPELSYLAQFDAGIDSEAGGLLVYRAEPSIVVTRQTLRHVDGRVTGHADVDILHNRRSVWRTDTPTLQSDPLQAMRLGAWDTLVEQEQLARQQSLLSRGSRLAAISPNRMFQDPDRRKRAPIVMRRAEDIEALAAVGGLHGDTRRALEEDLARGYVVALEAPGIGTNHMWWRIDPLTGETLGRGMDGRGQALTEKVALSVVAVKTAMVAGTAICMGTTKCALAQCLASTAITTAGVAVGTGVLGMAGSLGALLAAAAGVITHTGISHVMPESLQINACHWNP